MYVFETNFADVSKRLIRPDMFCYCSDTIVYLPHNFLICQLGILDTTSALTFCDTAPAFDTTYLKVSYSAFSQGMLFDMI